MSKFDEWLINSKYGPQSLVSAMNEEYGTTFSKTSIYRMRDGHNPSLELAVAIEDFTDGKLRCRDLLAGSVFNNPTTKKTQEADDILAEALAELNN